MSFVFRSQHSDAINFFYRYYISEIGNVEWRGENFQFIKIDCNDNLTTKGLLLSLLLKLHYRQCKGEKRTNTSHLSNDIF